MVHAELNGDLNASCAVAQCGTPVMDMTMFAGQSLCRGPVATVCRMLFPAAYMVRDRVKSTSVVPLEA